MSIKETVSFLYKSIFLIKSINNVFPTDLQYHLFRYQVAIYACLCICTISVSLTFIFACLLLFFFFLGGVSNLISRGKWKILNDYSSSLWLLFFEIFLTLPCLYKAQINLSQFLQRKLKKKLLRKLKNLYRKIWQ